MQVYKKKLSKLFCMQNDENNVCQAMMIESFTCFNSFHVQGRQKIFFNIENEGN